MAYVPVAIRGLLSCAVLPAVLWNRTLNGYLAKADGYGPCCRGNAQPARL